MANALAPSVAFSPSQVRAWLHEIADLARDAVSLESWLTGLGQALGDWIGFERLALLTPAGDGSNLTVRWAETALPARLVIGSIVPASEWSLARLLRQGRTSEIADLCDYLLEHPESPTTRCFVAESVRSLLLCPLVLTGEPVGVLVLTGASPHQFSEQQRALCDQLSAHLALCIERFLATA